MQDLETEVDKKDIAFDAVAIGSEQFQQLLVDNVSGLSLEYEWVFIDAKSSDIQKAAETALAMSRELLAASSSRAFTPFVDTGR